MTTQAGEGGTPGPRDRDEQPPEVRATFEVLRACLSPESIAKYDDVLREAPAVAERLEAGVALDQAVRASIRDVIERTDEPYREALRIMACLAADWPADGRGGITARWYAIGQALKRPRVTNKGRRVAPDKREEKEYSDKWAQDYAKKYLCRIVANGLGFPVPHPFTYEVGFAGFGDRAFGEISVLLSRARNEPTRRGCLNQLKEARRLIESHDHSAPQARRLLAYVHRELALESMLPDERAYHWKSSLSVVSADDGITDAYTPIARARIAIDASQDTYSTLSVPERTRALRLAKDGLKRLTGPDNKLNLLEYAQALGQKSAVLRAQSLRSNDPRNNCRKALRTAELAHQKDDGSPALLLELGLAEWAMARHESDDAQYEERCGSSETWIRSAADTGLEEARLALARFYRMTFKPLAACEAFPSLDDVKNSRLLLRESSILGEAAMGLWYDGSLNGEDVRFYLVQSRDLMEQALAAGYRHARIVITLAFVRAMLEGPPAGDTVLGDLVGEEAGIDWAAAMRIAVDATEEDLAAYQFALGISEGASLTRIGTFAADFMKDEKLALELYRGAARHAPKDPIVWTNLARFLIRADRKPSNADLREAARAVQKAEIFSDRRFRFWRDVKRDLSEAREMTRSRLAPS